MRGWASFGGLENCSIEANRRGEGCVKPVQGGQGAEIVLAEYLEGIAITPQLPAPPEPGAQAHRRIRHGVGKGLGVASVDGDMGLGMSSGGLHALHHPLFIVGVVIGFGRGFTEHAGHHRHGQINADQMTGVGMAELSGNKGPLVAALGAEALITQYIPHQLDPEFSDFVDIHASGGKWYGKSVAGQGGHDHIKTILGSAAMSHRVSQWVDNLA